ncbi:PIN domain-like protein [Endogone sp. FLAS-F59071]|nr:PIN domain-like protein [Endogone sp. FLAS-F59071]|eukprot:RUS21947.1 PIN domain-like protein [Endogone sp. FLAS-F59071]
MGVRNLTKLLQRFAPSAIILRDPSELRGKRVAVDASCHLNRFIFGDDPHPHRHLLGFYSLALYCRQHDIKPVFVFDGGTRVPEKKRELERRDRERHKVDMSLELSKERKARLEEWIASLDRATEVPSLILQKELERLELTPKFFEFEVETPFDHQKPSDPESKPEPVPEAKAQPESKVKAKLEPVPEAKAQPEPEVKAKLEAEPEPKVKAKLEAEPEPKPEPEPKAKAKLEPVTKAKAQPEPEVRAKLEAEPEPEVKAKLEAKPEPEPEPKAKLEPDAKAKSEPEPKAKLEPDPKAKSEPEPKAKLEPDPKAKSEPKAKAKLEPDPNLLRLASEIRRTQLLAADKEKYMRNQRTITDREHELICGMAQQEVISMKGPLEEMQTENHNMIVSLKKRAIRITQELRQESFNFLYEMGYPCFTCENHEAEAMCAKIATNGHADAVVTEDTDAVVFGDAPVFRHFFHSRIHPYAYPIMELNPVTARTALGLTRAAFIDLCILCGTDFSSTLPQIGPVRALDKIQKYGTIEAILATLEARHQLGPNDQFDYQAARKVFASAPDVPVDPREYELREPGKRLAEMMKRYKIDVEEVERTVRAEKITTLKPIERTGEKSGWGIDPFRDQVKII